MNFASGIRIITAMMIGSLFLTSCGDMTEEVHLEKDGSGKWEYTMDMSQTLQMMSMFGGMMEGNEDMGDIPEMNADELWRNLGEGEIDTTFNFRENIDAAQLEKLDHPEYLDNIKVNMTGNSDDQSLFLNMAFDFDSFEQLDAMFKEMEKISENAPEDEAAMMSQMPTMFMGGNISELYFFDKKKFIKKASDAAGLNMDSMLGEMGSEGQEMAGMMDMFFSDNEVTTIYHFPHKITSVSDDNAKVDGNTVTIVRDFKDYLENANKEELTIKFKKKFLGIF